MKIGAENRTKTAIAAVLILVAVVLFLRMLTAPATSTASPATPEKRTTNLGVADRSAALDTLNANAPAQRTGRRTDQGEKRLAAVLKPTLDPRLRLDLLKSSEQIKYEGSGRNIFNPQSEPVEIPTPVSNGRTDAQQAEAAIPQGPPPPPPINLKFFGYASKSGEPRSIFLSQQDTVYTAREGDIIAGRYKIVKINPTSVQIQDLLSNNTQTIPLTQG